MKKLFYHILGLLAALAAVSCDEIQQLADPEIKIPETMESVFSDGLRMDSQDGSAQVQFSATRAWSATVEEVTKAGEGSFWLSIEPSEGEAGDVTMKVSAMANESENLREALVTITCGDVLASFKVIQAGKEPPQRIPAQSIELEPNFAEMKVGETLQFVAKVLPENSTDKVEWTSLMEENATVKDGLVTALKEGYASIVASAGEVQAGCRIVIRMDEDGKIEATSIKLNKEEITVVTGLSEQLEVVEILPENATEKTVVWESSNPAIALVIERDATAEDGTFYRGGLVTGRDPGEAIITARAGVASAQCKVTVTSGGGSATIESLKVDPGMAKLAIGGETILTAIVTPSDAKVNIEWKSDNAKVVEVEKISDTQAKILGMSPGNTKVMAFAGGLMAYCEVAVEKGGGTTVAVESISLDQRELTLSIGQTSQLIATVLPENATDKTVTWNTTNDGVANVSANGLVYAVGTGRAVITASAGEVSAACAVTVNAGSGGSGLQNASVDPSSMTLNLDEEKPITLTLNPADAEVTIWWESSNTSIAKVTMKSKTTASIKGMAVGQAVVTCHAGDMTLTCQVTVENSNPGIPVESVTLNATEVQLKVNQQFQLVATVLPENATEKGVVWSSSVPGSKLYISTSGMLSALAECDATVTVRCKDNPNIYATCRVTVTSGGSSETEESVDLGLPSGLKWRSMNVGASKPEDYGDNFAWGETSTKSYYSWDNYKFGDSRYGPFSKYDTDGKKTLEAEDDAAAVNLGNGWRMATFAEWKELREKCTWTWTTRNGVGGMQVTGPNGNSIFLPAAGYYNTGLTMRGSYGSYWASTDAGITGMADAVDFISSGVDKAALYRNQGNSVRPVKN